MACGQGRSSNFGSPEWICGRIPEHMWEPVLHSQQSMSRLSITGKLRPSKNELPESFSTFRAILGGAGAVLLVKESPIWVLLLSMGTHVG